MALSLLLSLNDAVFSPFLLKPASCPCDRSPLFIVIKPLSPQHVRIGKNPAFYHAGARGVGTAKHPLYILSYFLLPPKDSGQLLKGWVHLYVESQCPTVDNDSVFHLLKLFTSLLSLSWNIFFMFCF